MPGWSSSYANAGSSGGWGEPPHQVGGDHELPGRKDFDMAPAAGGLERRWPLVKITRRIWRARESERAGAPAQAHRARTSGRKRREPVSGSKRGGLNDVVAAGTMARAGAAVAATASVLEARCR